MIIQNELFEALDASASTLLDVDGEQQFISGDARHVEVEQEEAYVDYELKYNEAKEKYALLEARYNQDVQELEMLCVNSNNKIQGTC